MTSATGNLPISTDCRSNRSLPRRLLITRQICRQVHLPTRECSLTRVNSAVFRPSRHLIPLLTFCVSVGWVTNALPSACVTGGCHASAIGVRLYPSSIATNVARYRCPRRICRWCCPRRSLLMAWAHLSRNWHRFIKLPARNVAVRRKGKPIPSTPSWNHPGILPAMRALGIIRLCWMIEPITGCPWISILVVSSTQFCICSMLVSITSCYGTRGCWSMMNRSPTC